MNIYFSELFCLGANPVEAVERMHMAGATHIELMLDGGGWNDFHLRTDVLADSLRRSDICYAVHTPVWEANLTCENSLIRAAVLEGYKHSIIFAAQLGAQHVVIHPGFCNAPCFDKAQARGRAAEAIDTLFAFNRSYGVRLLIENVGTPATSLYTMAQYIDFCNALPPEGGALVDVGHAHISGWNFETLFAGLGGRLTAMHLHDNDGISDSHQPIREGSIDWQRLAALVRSMEVTPELILEYNIGYSAEKIREGKAFLEKHFQK